MMRALPLLLCALAACEPREGPVGPEAEASPPVSSAPAPIAPPAVAPPAVAPLATPAPAPTPAPVAPVPPVATSGPLACGDQQCGPTQICIEAQLPPSAKPNAEAKTSTFTCANDAMKGAGFKCDDPKDRRQRCVALTPGTLH